MNQSLCNGAKRAREFAGSIFNCLPSDFDSPATRLAKFGTLIGLTSINGVNVYNTLAPLLYLEYEGFNDKDKIFLNPILIRVRQFQYDTKYI